MSFDPAIGSSRFPTRTSPSLNPEREVRQVAEALIDSAERLAAAADLVENKATARSLAEMAHMRRTAADTVVALAGDAGVVVREDVSGTVGGTISRGISRLTSGDDAELVDDLLAGEDRLVVRLDAALGEGLPASVKDQLRLTGAQVRDGLRAMASWS
jgi:hypothetical protein